MRDSVQQERKPRARASLLSLAEMFPAAPPVVPFTAHGSFLAAREAGEMWSLHKAALPRNRAVHC